MKTYNKMVFASLVSIATTSCVDLLDTAPYDQLSPSTFWKTEADANSAVVACYNDWANSSDVFFADVMSDIGYNNSGSSKYKYVGDGSLSQSSTVNYYSYTTIRRCNTFLANAQNIPYSSDKVKKDLFAQVRTIRAYRYFLMNFWYGGVPLITGLPENAEEAKLPQSSEADVKAFIYKELDEVIPDLNAEPAEKGRIAQGTALALKMRAALYWGDYELALAAANSIKSLKQYQLDNDFLNMFTLVGQTSKEIICAIQHVETTYPFENLIRLYNNQDGGWATMVPTENLVNMYEMNSGLLPEEANSGYDPVHPYANRDPRLCLTIVYPGQDWVGSDKKVRIINTLEKNISGKTNTDYYLAADNASKTGLIWTKYTTPRSQYSVLNDSGVCPILFRYADVLLTIAEADVELSKNTLEVFDILDQLRIRGGHKAVDRAKYNTQDKLRELVRRERCIELAGEGLRRADIIRWKTSDGKLLAEKVMNQTLCRMIGTVNYDETDPTMRATIIPGTDQNLPSRKIENRVFYPYQRYLPFPQAELDKNLNLKQNEGYDK